MYDDQECETNEYDEFIEETASASEYEDILETASDDPEEYEEIIEVASESEYEEIVEPVESDDLPSDDLYNSEDENLINQYFEKLELKGKSTKKKGKIKNNCDNQKETNIENEENECSFEETFESASSSSESDDDSGCYECHLFGFYCVLHGTPDRVEDDPIKQEKTPADDIKQPTFHISHDMSYPETHRKFSFKKALMIETRITYRHRNGEYVPRRKTKKLPLPDDIKEKFLRGEIQEPVPEKRKQQNDHPPKPKPEIDEKVIQALTPEDIANIHADARKRGRGRPKRGLEITIRPCHIKKMKMPGYQEKRGRPASRALAAFQEKNQRRIMRILETEADPTTRRLFGLIIGGLVSKT